MLHIEPGSVAKIKASYDLLAARQAALRPKCEKAAERLAAAGNIAEALRMSAQVYAEIRQQPGQKTWPTLFVISNPSTYDLTVASFSHDLQNRTPILAPEPNHTINLSLLREKFSLQLIFCDGLDQAPAAGSLFARLAQREIRVELFRDGSDSAGFSLTSDQGRPLVPVVFRSNRGSVLLTPLGLEPGAESYGLIGEFKSGIFSSEAINEARLYSALFLHCLAQRS